MTESQVRVYIDEVEAMPIAFFVNGNGLAVDQSADKVLIFENGPNWSAAQMSIDDIRRVENIVTTPGEYVTSRRGGVGGIGEGIGALVGNALEKSKAKKESGLKIYFKSVRRPTMFIGGIDDQSRDSLFEGLNQVLEGRSINGVIHRIPSDVRQYFHRPTQSELQAQEQKRVLSAERARLRPKRWGIAFGGLLTLGLVWLLFSEFSKSAYLAAASDVEKINSASAIMCLVYKHGYEHSVKIRGATASNILIRDVQVVLPQPNKLNQEKFTFEKGSFAIGKDLSYAPAKMPKGGFRYFIDVDPEDRSAFQHLPRPEC